MKSSQSLRFLPGARLDRVHAEFQGQFELNGFAPYADRETVSIGSQYVGVDS